MLRSCTHTLCERDRVNKTWFWVRTCTACSKLYRSFSCCPLIASGSLWESGKGGKSYCLSLSLSLVMTRSAEVKKQISNPLGPWWVPCVCVCKHNFPFVSHAIMRWWRMVVRALVKAHDVIMRRYLLWHTSQYRFLLSRIVDEWISCATWGSKSSSILVNKLHHLQIVVVNECLFTYYKRMSVITLVGDHKIRLYHDADIFQFEPKRKK